ncbi:hypothetical protein [Lacunimicrobium album]|jgi:AmiR/NasT family two-component response regulator
MPSGLFISNDLFFISKVTGTGTSLGYPIRVISKASAFTEALTNPEVNAVFVDLEQKMLPLDQLVAAIPNREQVTLIAFGAHVQVDVLKAARALGFEAVMPRSQFTSDLPAIITHLKGASPA